MLFDVSKPIGEPTRCFPFALALIRSTIGVPFSFPESSSLASDARSSSPQEFVEVSYGLSSFSSSTERFCKSLRRDLLLVKTSTKRRFSGCALAYWHDALVVYGT